jgi:hypothetical protein
LPAWIYVRGKIQFESMRCLEGIECTYTMILIREAKCIWKGTCKLKEQLELRQSQDSFFYVS